MNYAIFLDRDGTLIKNRGYICKYKDVEFYPFSIEALKLIQKNNFMIVIVTNQSSIARGICSENDVRQIHLRMGRNLEKQGIKISGFYYCPFHSEGTVPKYKSDSPLRKPKPGMIIQAANELNINLSKSYMVGDNITDVFAGQKAGCKTVIVKTGHGNSFLEEIKKKKIVVDIISKNLLFAVKKIIKNEKIK